MAANSFRKKRGMVLARNLLKARSELKRNIVILDVGGREEYWDNVNLEGVDRIIILNNDESEFLHRGSHGGAVFEFTVGDARNLAEFADSSIDFVHSNSVIEHVGPWWDMKAMAQEGRRVGRHGWVQTPACEFPIEPHYGLPFLHWLAAPMRRKLLRLSPVYGRLSIDEKRFHVDRINLLSSREVGALFPDCGIYVERVLGLPKSYTAIW